MLLKNKFYFGALVFLGFAGLLVFLVKIANASIQVAAGAEESKGTIQALGLPGRSMNLISFSAVAFGVSFLEYLMSQADKILIGFYLNAREVGIYAVAMALVAFLPIVLQSVNQIFSPTIADLYARGQIELLAASSRRLRNGSWDSPCRWRREW